MLESAAAHDGMVPGADSARASTERGVLTGPLADLGEACAYKQALTAGEIGLQAPFGANRPGADFVTAIFDPDDGYRIVLTDAKTSFSNQHPVPAAFAPLPWLEQARQAVLAADLGDPGLERLLRIAWARGDVYLRQIDVDASPSGQMRTYTHALVPLS